MSEIPANPRPIPIANGQVVNVYDDDTVAIFDSSSGIPVRSIPPGSTVPPLILASIRRSGLEHFGRRVPLPRNIENRLNDRSTGSAARGTTEVERGSNQDNAQRVSIEKERNEDYQQLRDRAAREYRYRLRRLGELTESEASDGNPFRQAQRLHQRQRLVTDWREYLEKQRLLASGELNDRAATDLRRELERQEVLSIRRNDAYSELLGWYEVHRYGVEEADRRMRNRLAHIEIVDTHGSIDIDREAHLMERIEARHSAVAGPFAAIGQIIGTAVRHAQGEQYDPTVHTNENFQAAGAALDGIAMGLTPLAAGAVNRRNNNSRQASNSDRGLDPRQRAHGAPLAPQSQTSSAILPRNAPTLHIGPNVREIPELATRQPSGPAAPRWINARGRRQAPVRLDGNNFVTVRLSDQHGDRARFTPPEYGSALVTYTMNIRANQRVVRASRHEPTSRAAAIRREAGQSFHGSFHTGHLRSAINNGIADVLTSFPQLGSINSGAWRMVEGRINVIANSIARSAAAHGQGLPRSGVQVHFRTRYETLRQMRLKTPSEFIVSIRFNGRTYGNLRVSNRAGSGFKVERWNSTTHPPERYGNLNAMNIMFGLPP